MNSEEMASCARQDVRLYKTALDVVIDDIKEAREYAVIAGLDHHFISEIEHLIATAYANKEGEANQ